MRFFKLMNPQTCDINYSDNHKLNYGNKTFDEKKEHQNYDTEFYMYNKEFFKDVLEVGDINQKYTKCINKPYSYLC